MLNSVTLAYLPQNSPPVVKSINVITQSAPAARPRKAAPAASSAAYSRDGHRYRRCRRTSSAGTPTQTLSRAATQQITVTWQAEDPDGDRLVYSVYFRGEDETPVEAAASAALHENSLTFDGDVLADGKYFFRVTGVRPRGQSARQRRAKRS